MIRKEGKWYVIRSKHTGKRLGRYRSRAAAEKRLQQIHYFKNVNK